MVTTQNSELHIVYFVLKLLIFVIEHDGVIFQIFKQLF